MKFASKWEEQYRNMLELKYRAGEILAYAYESITFRLAPKTTYTPDFLVVLPDGKVQIHEVKGFAREDAIIKFKVAAQQNPWFEFIMVKKSKTEGWVEMLHFNSTYPQTEIISVTDHHPQKKDSKQFLLYSPLNQGLKHVLLTANILHIRVFTLQSIKSRIETAEQGI